MLISCLLRNIAYTQTSQLGDSVNTLLWFMATERHLPYGITQSYLGPNAGERTPP